ncbi:MAG TPA: hypothetical protein VGO90_05500 [Chthoniobacteraceae bacterium]|jgi:hypothetical protein|nr:hypothetical protein [Chthoniobacter sp.]HEV7867114.1 hypothetical protein [Chthoniobacteraceae bacterium]
MKPFTFLLLGLALTAGLTSDVRSQAAAPPRSALQQLQAIVVQNQQLIQRQAATVAKLEELQLQAQQLKFFGKRS